MSFSSGGTALLRGDSLGLPALAEFDFESGLKRYWSGLGRLKTLDGREWEGVGNFGSVSDITTSEGLVADKVTVEFAREAEVNGEMMAIEATDFAAAIREALREDYVGRRCAIYVQPIDLSATRLRDALQGDPDPRFAGKMSHPEADIMPDAVAFRIVAENLFAEGLDPPHAYLTNVDQQARFPGDRFCEFIPELTQRRVNWFS